MIESLKKILKHKSKASYEEYQKVEEELFNLMFPEWYEDFYTLEEKFDFSEQYDKLVKTFPKYYKKEYQEILKEFEKPA